MNGDFWAGRRVFVTGHTGFKGSWLALWLAQMGAKVYGYALPPEQVDGIYSLAHVAPCLAGETLADIRDSAALSMALHQAQPEIVLHLAAQPLVRASYQQPVETYSTNVMGLISVFEAVRSAGGIRAVVNVTSDKCYENREWVWPYRENESMGGHDPYSASKACAEIVSASYRRSFMADAGIALATARAGNVIGGGDRAADRLVPDFLRAMDNAAPLVLRNPAATRPWQHVLEPLSGYLTLAQRLIEDPISFADAWNFGPSAQDIRSVGDIANLLANIAQCPPWVLENGAQPHEAQSLSLDSAKARSLLPWTPRLTIETALDMTVQWHKAWRSGADMAQISREQILQYLAA